MKYNKRIYRYTSLYYNNNNNIYTNNNNRCSIIVSFRKEVFEYLNNNKHIDLQTLYLHFKDHNRGTIERYYYHWKRHIKQQSEGLSTEQILTIIARRLLDPNTPATAIASLTKQYLDIKNAKGTDKEKTIIEQFTEWKDTKS